MEELNEYLIILKKINDLQNTLVSAVNNVVQLIPAKFGGDTFSPTARTISEQLKNWPKGLLILPIDTWISPRHGEISAEHSSWAFSCTGQGISFRNLIDSTSVVVEYSINGEICLTEWIVYSYLTSCIRNGRTNPAILEKHAEMFSWLVEHKILIESPSRPDFPEKVFLLSEATL